MDTIKLVYKCLKRYIFIIYGINEESDTINHNLPPKPPTQTARSLFYHGSLVYTFERSEMRVSRVQTHDL